MVWLGNSVVSGVFSRSKGRYLDNFFLPQGVFGQCEGGGSIRDYALVGLRPDAYYIGTISEISGRGIAAYIPGGEGKGFLKAITLQGDTIHEVDLGELDSGGERYQELFGSPPTVAMQEITIP